MTANKSNVEELAVFGGPRLFDSPKPTSNLVRPDRDRFFEYAARAFVRPDELVRELESRLADMHEVEHCVAMGSGFWALALAIDALRIEGRTEVVLPSLT